MTPLGRSPRIAADGTISFELLSPSTSCPGLQIAALPAFDRFPAAAFFHRPRPRGTVLPVPNFPMPSLFRLILLVASATLACAQSSLVFNPPAGVKPQGKHVVLLFAEARPELGILPVDDNDYQDGSQTNESGDVNHTQTNNRASCKLLRLRYHDCSI